MINLDRVTEALARRLADAQHLSVDDMIRFALEAHARAAGLAECLPFSAKRMTARDILAVGAEIAAMPVLDQRSAREIMDDLQVL